MASNVQRGSLMQLRTALAVTLGILLLGIPYGISAQTPNADLSIGDGSGFPGDTGISVAVSLSSNDGALVWGANFDLVFDDSQLEFVSAVIGSAASSTGKDFVSSLIPPNRVRVGIIDLEADPEPISNGTVAVVTFNVLPSASPGDYALTLENYTVTDLASQELPVNPSNGTFTVLAPAATDTPTETPTDTLTPTRTLPPTSTGSAAPTNTRAASRTPTLTVSAGPTNTRIPSRTPTITRTPTRTVSPTRTKYVSPTPTGTITPATPTPDITASGTVVAIATLTPTPEGGNFIDLRGVAGTQTAEAGIELAVAATATALAEAGGGGPTNDLVSAVLDWVLQNATWLMLGGLGLGAIVIALWMGFAIFRGPKPAKK